MKRALLVLATAAWVVVYAIIDLRHALAAWTAAYEMALSTAVGALALMLALDLAHATWWHAVERPLRIALGPLPVLAAWFVPIAMFSSRLYGAPRSLGFAGRTAIAFAVFLLASRLRRVAGLGLTLAGLAFTVTSFDTWMALERGWHSTVYGLYTLAGGLVGATSILAIGAWAESRRRLELAPDHFHAIGRLMLMAVMLWAYLGFFQLLLIWIANLPSEIPFYRARASATWAVVDVVLVLGHFALPFLLLLSRRVKRSARAVAAIGAWLVVMHAVDAVWLVHPSVGVPLSWLDVAPFALVLAVTWALRGAPARELSPRAREALEYRSP